MGNTMHAHLFKRRQVGEREEVTLKLYYPDGTPCNLETLEDGGGESHDLDQVMRWQGGWTEFDGNHNYGDVVLYNGALWFALDTFDGEPGVDERWDPVIPASMLGGEGASGSSWQTVIHRAEAQLTDSSSVIPDMELTFTVGDSGMVMLYASAMFKVSMFSAYFQILADGVKEIANGSTTNPSYTFFSLTAPTSANPVASLREAGGNIPASLPAFSFPGLMLVMEPGEHTLQFKGWGDSPTGTKCKEARLAVMPL